MVGLDGWGMERMFENRRGELGLDHFEVRRYGSLCRHLLLTCLSHLFLAEYRQHQKKRYRTDDSPSVDGDAGAGGSVVPGWPMLTETSRIDLGAIGDNAATQRQGATQPPQANGATIRDAWHQVGQAGPMPVAQNVAL